MSSNLEYRARESRRQASEAQRGKGRQRSRARDKKRRHFFLLEEQHENFIVATNQIEGENER